MNKPLRITLSIILLIVSTFIGLFLNIYLFMAIYRPAAYGKSMKLREFVCDIPELSSGYAPQGIGYSAEKDMYIATGYAKDNESVLYLIKDNVPTRVYIADKDGKVIKGHAGGITCAKDFVYMANGSELQIFSLDSLTRASGAERIKAIGTKAVTNTAAYVSTDSLGENLFVGEFYRAGNYETDKRHYYTTPSGSENKAIMSCYTLNADGSILGEEPKYAVSVPGLVQGATVYVNPLDRSISKFFLSRSYALVDSKLEYYDGITYTGQNITLDFPAAPELGEVSVALYYLDNGKGGNMTKSLTLPAFSEDLTMVNNRVVVTNENACNKYIVGKFFGGGKVYSYPIDF